MTDIPSSFVRAGPASHSAAASPLGPRTPHTLTRGAARRWVRSPDLQGLRARLRRRRKDRLHQPAGLQPASHRAWRAVPRLAPGRWGKRHGVTPRPTFRPPPSTQSYRRTQRVESFATRVARRLEVDRRELDLVEERIRTDREEQAKREVRARRPRSCDGLLQRRQHWLAAAPAVATAAGLTRARPSAQARRTALHDQGLDPRDVDREDPESARKLRHRRERRRMRRRDRLKAATDVEMLGGTFPYPPLVYGVELQDTKGEVCLVCCGDHHSWGVGGGCC